MLFRMQENVSMRVLNFLGEHSPKPPWWEAPSGLPKCYPAAIRNYPLATKRNETPGFVSYHYPCAPCSHAQNKINGVFKEYDEWSLRACKHCVFFFASMKSDQICLAILKVVYMYAW